jgi:hypothetical protein
LQIANPQNYRLDSLLDPERPAVAPPRTIVKYPRVLT